MTPVPIGEPAPVPTRMRAGSAKAADADRRSPPVARRPGGSHTPSEDGPPSPSIGRPPRSGRRKFLVLAGASVGRPASCGLRGACSRPRGIQPRMGRASCPPRGGLRPQQFVGGLGRREKLVSGERRGKRRVSRLAMALGTRGGRRPRAVPVATFGSSRRGPGGFRPGRGRVPPAASLPGPVVNPESGLLFHVCTLPKIPYITGFFARQAH